MSRIHSVQMRSLPSLRKTSWVLSAGSLLASLAWFGGLVLHVYAFFHAAPFGELLGVLLILAMLLASSLDRIEELVSVSQEETSQDAPKHTLSWGMIFLGASLLYGLLCPLLAMIAWFLLTRDPFYSMVWAVSGGWMFVFGCIVVKLSDLQTRRMVSKEPQESPLVPVGSLSEVKAIPVGGKLSLLLGERGELSLDEGRMHEPQETPHFAH